MAASILDMRGRWPRRRVAPTVNSQARLDAHQVKALPTDAGNVATVIVETSTGRTRVTVRRTPTHRGGFRLDWHCPGCGRAARYLYGWPLLCRRCAGLRYESSQAHHDMAAAPAVARKLAAVSARLRASPNARAAPPRPARMSRRVYFELLIEWHQLRELNEALLLRLLCGGLCGSFYDSLGVDRDEVRQVLAVADQVRRWRRLLRIRSDRGLTDDR